MQGKTDVCFVFDKWTTVRLVEDDPEIPAVECLPASEANSTVYTNLMTISDMDSNINVNIIAVVRQIGPVETVELKSGL